MTKSGGNEFHGSVWGTFTPGALQGRAKTVTTAGAVVSGKRDLDNIGDFGATLGGYIVKDKFWFFAGIQPSFTRYSYKRQFYIENPGQTDADGNQAYSLIPNSEQRRFADEKSIQFIGKLTYLINSDHRLSLTVTGTPTTGGSDAAFPVRVPGCSGRAPFPIAAYTLQTFNSNHYLTNDTAYDVSGELNSSFMDKKLLLDVRLGWHHQLDEGAPGDGSGFDNIHNLNDAGRRPARLRRSTSATCSTSRTRFLRACARPAAPAIARRSARPPGSFTVETTSSSGRSSTPSRGRRPSPICSHALGHHVIKAGVDGSISYYDHLKSYGGGAWYFDFGPGWSRSGELAGWSRRRAGSGTSRTSIRPPGTATPHRQEQVDHHRRLRPGQLEHPRQGHPERRPALGRPVPLRQDGLPA